MSWMQKHEAFFITGTDTDIGKTLVSAILMSGLKGTYWKPVQSGIETGMTDKKWLQNHTGLAEEYFWPEAYLLNNPCSPHLAAQIDGIQIDLDNISLPANVDRRPLIVEGAGGILVPLNATHFMLDLMKKFAFPIILVASSQLGTINHTLLSLYRLRDAGLQIIGVILNGPLNRENKEAIERYGQTRVLAQVEPLAEIDENSLLAAFNECFAR